MKGQGRKQFVTKVWGDTEGPKAKNKTHSLSQLTLTTLMNSSNCSSLSGPLRIALKYSESY